MGYGDFAPTTETGRILATVFIPFAVGIMGIFLETVANAIIDQRRRRYQEYLHNKPLTLHDIRILDADGDGEVTRAEFLEFMLVAMNQVDKGLLNQLKDHFNRLDYDHSGTINKNDLAEMAKQQLTQNVSDKLRSAQYKSFQLHQPHHHRPSPDSATTVSSTADPPFERRLTQPTNNTSGRSRVSPKDQQQRKSRPFSTKSYQNTPYK